LRGIVAALLILPLAELILPGGLSVSDPSWLGLAGVLLAGALTAAGMGLVLGTAVPPNRISVAFAIVLTPLIFTGATFYPWSSLDTLPWFQAITLLNPLTYVSEGLRASLIDTPHLAVGWIALGLLVSLGVLGALGTRGFVRRAVN